MRFTSLFRRVLPGGSEGAAPLYLYNTRGKELQPFTLSPRSDTVRMYNCGPTVYGPQHIGNLSMFVFTDVLRRTLEYNGFPVKQVINITDVGHLSSDADEGEDKMTKGLKREGMEVTLHNMRTLADRYTDAFFTDLRTLNIDTSRIEFPRASDHIDAQIAMVRTLEEKGYAYTGKEGVYFDTSLFPAYGALGGIDLGGLKEGARVASTGDKRSPTDFLLWKFDKKIGWDSPWGKGFPGWHLECSAMIRRTLGERIDIHTGGIEHIPVHHNNEIAQSECATGKSPLSRFWLHRAHIQIAGGKIAKSEGSVVYLADLVREGFHPLSLRYLFLTAHYRSAMNFTREALTGAESAYAKLLSARLASDSPLSPSDAWVAGFREKVNNDLDTPGAIAYLWDSLKDASSDIAAGMLVEADKVLGLRLAEPTERERALVAKYIKTYIPEAQHSAQVEDILVRRKIARESKQWEVADTLRDELAVLGYGVDDTEEGQKIYPVR
jgi:cysteinyl-tRNA synthetase